MDAKCFLHHRATVRFRTCTSRISHFRAESRISASGNKINLVSSSVLAYWRSNNQNASLCRRHRAAAASDQWECVAGAEVVHENFASFSAMTTTSQQGRRVLAVAALITLVSPAVLGNVIRADNKLQPPSSQNEEFAALDAKQQQDVNLRTFRREDKTLTALGNRTPELVSRRAGLLPRAGSGSTITHRHVLARDEAVGASPTHAATFQTFAYAIIGEPPPQPTSHGDAKMTSSLSEFRIEPPAQLLTRTSAVVALCGSISDCTFGGNARIPRRTRGVVETNLLNYNYYNNNGNMTECRPPSPCGWFMYQPIERNFLHYLQVSAESSAALSLVSCPACTQMFVSSRNALLGGPRRRIHLLLGLHVQGGLPRDAS
ncbi:hypothetical protein HPB51_009237 [Rhipicephalus microplus]|uniref:Uncharacterized protein n=1 Tax=Rhipicephalus microplus TaxID=6941 RepID=A0A9J6F0L0_RHIMP|nr:hypothetical protein HPB51_009237 [Rhipicephalus microplus]